MTSAAKQYGVPAFPQTLHASPSSYWINDLVRAHLEGGVRKLKEFGLFGLVGGPNATEAFKRLDNLQIDATSKRNILSVAQDGHPYALWSKTRSVYDVHPQMTTSLMSLRSTTKIPASMFRRLRHPNPFFVTPAAPSVMHADGHPGRILGFYMTGAYSPRYELTPGLKAMKIYGEGPDGSIPRGGAMLFGTDESTPNALHAMVVSEVHDLDETKVIDLDFCHITLPMVGEFTVAGLVEEIIQSGFAWSHDMKATPRGEAQSSYLATMAHAVVSHLIYAVSRTSEIDEGKNDRPPARTKKGEPKGPKPAKVHRIGYRTGSAIADSVRRAQERPAGVPTGREMPPHIRAAHPHLYRVGAGRQELELKFLGPIPVNLHKDDGDTTTMHPMR